MSNITKSNIDEWFFRYTENDLSVDEKSQFMSYILEHPEYNEEFMLWLNTKITKNIKPENDLEASLLRPENIAPLKFPKKTIYVVVPIVILSALVVLWYWFYPFHNESVVIPKKIIVSKDNNDKTSVTGYRYFDKSNVESRVIRDSISLGKSKIQPNVLNENIEVGINVKHQNEADSLQILNQHILETSEQSEVFIETFVPNVVDSVPNIEKIKKEHVEEKRLNVKNKIKAKNKFSLKRTKDFQKDNSEF